MKWWCTSMRYGSSIEFISDLEITTGIEPFVSSRGRLRISSDGRGFYGSFGTKIHSRR